MKEVYELNIYKLKEELSVFIWYAFDGLSMEVKKSPKLSVFIRKTK